MLIYERQRGYVHPLMSIQQAVGIPQPPSVTSTFITIVFQRPWGSDIDVFLVNLTKNNYTKVVWASFFFLLNKAYGMTSFLTKIAKSLSTRKQDLTEKIQPKNNSIAPKINKAMSEKGHASLTPHRGFISGHLCRSTATSAEYNLVWQTTHRCLQQPDSSPLSRGRAVTSSTSPDKHWLIDLYKNRCSKNNSWSLKFEKLIEL